MKFTKPDLDRTHVEARNPKTKERVCFTVYDCTPQEFAEKVGAVPSKPRKPRRAKQPA